MYILTIDKLPKFLLGGRADFVVKDINNQDHINFKLIKVYEKDSIYAIYYMSTKRVYLGKVHIDIKGELFLKFMYVVDSNLSNKQEIFRKLILYIFGLHKLPSNLAITYTGICSICGRTLSDPESIERGIGKVCLTRI